jgi:hypothetical protein
MGTIELKQGRDKITACYGDTDPDAGRTTALNYYRAESSSHLPDWKAVCIIDTRYG